MHAGGWTGGGRGLQGDIATQRKPGYRRRLTLQLQSRNLTAPPLTDPAVDIRATVRLQGTVQSERLAPKKEDQGPQQTGTRTRPGERERSPHPTQTDSLHAFQQMG
jgi:hypothetical protein